MGKEKKYETLYKSNILNKVFNSVAELEEAEAEYNASIKAKEEKSLARKEDLVKVQDAAKAYLKLIEKNKETRAELEQSEKDAYDAYKAELNAFAEKHSGYHLTYSIDGDNVEFKIEEARTTEFERIIKEQENRIKNFWNNFFNF